MRILYEVTAKVESGMMDGSRQTVFHGNLTVDRGTDSVTEPVPLAIRVSDVEWNRYDIGDVLVFVLADGGPVS